MRTMDNAWKKESLTDAINLVLGAWLFLSPWIFAFTAESATSWNAWISGIVIAAFAIAALTAFAVWEEWLNLIVGLWVAVSPWLVGFSANTTATRLHVIVGLIVAAIAAVRLWLTRQNPPHVTT